MKRFSQLTAIVAAAFALSISAPAFAGQPVTSSVQIPFTGTVFVPLDNGSTDAVTLSGMVHVVTHVLQIIQPQDPIRIMINLDQVSGVGDISGLRYNATGANRVNLPAQPNDPINLGFNLKAEGPPQAPPDPFAARAHGSLVPSIKYVLLPNPRGPNPGAHGFSDNQEPLVNTIFGWLKDLKL